MMVGRLGRGMECCEAGGLESRRTSGSSRWRKGCWLSSGLPVGGKEYISCMVGLGRERLAGSENVKKWEEVAMTISFAPCPTRPPCAL